MRVIMPALLTQNYLECKTLKSCNSFTNNRSGLNLY